MRNYEIAAHYYERIFKVYPYDPSEDTRFSGTCIDVDIPSDIANNGFDV